MDTQKMLMLALIIVGGAIAYDRGFIPGTSRFEDRKDQKKDGV